VVESRYDKVSIKAFMQRVEKRYPSKAGIPHIPLIHSPSAIRIRYRVQDFFSFLTGFAQINILRGNPVHESSEPQRQHSRDEKLHPWGKRQDVLPSMDKAGLSYNYSVCRARDIHNLGPQAGLCPTIYPI
jgi:hypothetical protein